jgi:hypothetical protein
MANGPLYRYLDTVGDGSGVKEHAVDYSGASATKLLIKPPAGEVYVVERMLVAIVAAGQVLASKYGDQNALSNGLLVVVERDEDLLADLTDEVPIKTNSDWGRLCFDVLSSGVGPGDTYVLIRWTFGRAGKPIFLDGDRDDALVVLAHDTFAPLTSHTFMVQGHKR